MRFRIPWSVDCLIGALIAVLSLAIPLHWGFHAALLVIAWIITIDLLLRLPYSKTNRAILSICACALIGFLVIPSILEEFRVAHASIESKSAVSASLPTLASASASGALFGAHGENQGFSNFSVTTDPTNRPVFDFTDSIGAQMNGVEIYGQNGGVVARSSKDFRANHVSIGLPFPGVTPTPPSTSSPNASQQPQVRLGWPEEK